MKQLTLLFVTALTIISCKTNKKTKADTILFNATFYTLYDSLLTAEAVAIKDGKILAVGTKTNIFNTYETTDTQNLNGSYVYPGFIDGHAHFYGLGMFTSRTDLTGCKSFDEVLQRVQEFAATNNEPWLLGRGWDQNIWENKQFPDKAQLDELFPEKPVLLKRVDGHAALANQKALDLAGITAKTVIAGGKVEVKNGKLTGILVDNAVDALEKAIPPPTNAQVEAYLLKAQAVCLANGLTTVVDAGLEKRYIDIIKKLQDEGKLKIRLNVMVSADSAGLAYYIKNGPIKTPLLNVNSFKLYGDGALGSRGACLLQPYHDEPSTHGFLLSSPQKLEEVVKRVAASNFQLCTHAIGDSAGRFILDAYGKALGPNNNRRWRIEHAQVISTEDVTKFKQFGILPSMQPTHAMSDINWADERLGEERLKQAYMLKTLMEQNGMIILGTDFPVETVSPIRTFYTAVERQEPSKWVFKSSNVYTAEEAAKMPWAFQPENRLNRTEALKGMTIWAAYGSFEEKEKGTIEPGKWADFTVLDADLLNGAITWLDSNDNYHEASVISTWIGGKKVFGK